MPRMTRPRVAPLIGLVLSLLATEAFADVAGDYVGCLRAPTDEMLIPSPIDFMGGGTYTGDSGFFFNKPTGWALTGTLSEFTTTAETPADPADLFPVASFEYSGVMDLRAEKLFGDKLTTKHAIYDFTMIVQWRQ